MIIHKIIKKITKIIIIVFIAFLVMSMITPLVLYLHSFSITDPLEPEIKYAEFPFELVYEINGEIITVNDTYVCEYDGVSVYEGTQKARQWKGYVKSIGDEDLALVLVQDGNTYLVCTLGSPGYYMKDPDYEYGEPRPQIIYVIKPNDMGGVSSGVAPETLDPLLEKYQLKIISWEFSDPIENEYKAKEIGSSMYVFIGCVIAFEVLFIVLAIVSFIKKGKISQNKKTEDKSSS